MGRTSNTHRLLLLVLATGLNSGLLAAGYEYPIAGLAPAQRPAGAPVITQYEKPAAWYTGALHGVARPYPPSLRFLEDQGAWHTPFNRPGMYPPYDVRGWHTN